MLYISAKPGDKLNLGRKGENLARTILFDISQWRKLYGDGVVALLNQRAGDAAPYPCNIETDGNTVAWPITASDTAVASQYGKYELQYRVNDQLAKSSTGAASVYESLGDSTAEPPEAQQGWVDQVLQAAARAEAAAVRQPVPNPDTGTWWVWDAKSGEYVDSGETYRGEGNGSGGTADAVQYIKQSLTADQQAQARENIGAQIADFVVNMVPDGIDNGLTPDKTWAELTEAYLAGRRLSCYYNGREYECVFFYEGEEAHFVHNNLVDLREYRIYFTHNGVCYYTENDPSNRAFPVLSVNGMTGYVVIPEGIPAPATASVGQTIVVKAVDADGKPTEWEAKDVASGLANTEKSLLLSLFKNAAYTADMSATIAQLEALWSGSEDPDEPVEPDLPEADVSQTGSILSIVSGVTVSQSGSVLAIA